MRLSMHKRRQRKPRKKNPVPLAGLPRDVIRLAPASLPPEKKAEFCRRFIVEAAREDVGDERLRGIVRSFLGNAFAGHGAAFPLALAARCVESASRPGALVLDPFLGTGTTLVAARDLGRRGVGVELNPAFAEMARRRLAGFRPGDRLPAKDRKEAA